MTQKCHFPVSRTLLFSGFPQIFYSFFQFSVTFLVLFRLSAIKYNTPSSLYILGSGSGSLVFNELNVSPSPIVIPGDVTVNFDAESLATIENFNVKFDITKYLFGIPIPVPCVDGIGSWYV